MMGTGGLIETVCAHVQKLIESHHHLEETPHDDDAVDQDHDFELYKIFVSVILTVQNRGCGLPNSVLHACMYVLVFSRESPGAFSWLASSWLLIPVHALPIHMYDDVMAVHTHVNQHTPWSYLSYASP